MPMLIFLSVALLFYGALHGYALRKIFRAFSLSKPARLALALVALFLTLSPFGVRLLEKSDYHSAAVITAWISYPWMGYVLLFFCVGLPIDACNWIARRLNRRWPLTEAGSFVVIALLSLALLGYGFYAAQQIRVEHITITTPKLPAGEITIAQISDLHLGLLIGDRFVDKVMDRLKEIQPDIVVATGDLVDGQGDHLNSLSRHFHAYVPPLGAYAVTGNHEYYVGVEHSLRFLHSAGFRVLRGEAVNAGAVVLAGVDDLPRRFSGQEVRADVRKALASVSGDAFVVLLKHKPIVDPDARFDLQLSGHTHGGQIFPFAYPTRLVNGVPTGLIPLDQGRQLYVSRGVGTWGPPIRLFADPEITLITIKSSRP